MPSLLHEGLVTLFRDHPALAPELLAARGVFEMLDPATEKLRRMLERLRRIEAKKEDRALAYIEVALMLLSRRFGQIPQAIQDRVFGASLSELKALVTRILDATTLEEALGELA